MSDSNSSNSVPIIQPWEKSSSPYFWSNSDNPGVLLVVQYLTEDNYSIWSRAILIALDVKSKIGFIDGSLLKLQSVDHPLYTAWIFSQSVVYFKTAREVWLDLQHRFSQGNGPHIFELRQEICSLAQEDLSISSYYTKFKSLWQELLDYRNCSCGHQAEDCVMSFLMGLNETYTIVRGQILLMDPIPSMGKVFSLLIQDEKQRKVGKKNSIESSALAVKANGSSKSFNKAKSGKPQCTHCGVSGHVVDKCYKLYGYPPGYKFKNKGSQATSFANNFVVADASLNESVNLTHLEYQQLLSLLNSHSHFGTQAPPGGGSDTRQVANIITQPTITL
ncbi:uncharacterized protein LOC115994750 [Quercus lobata]|uniref:uncharacterized protein LOC115994750 n=1 Tax=Quercus lobata TaxID=97700 RepID=UPI001248796F|nr:uncharacterized protein LOC115994750 [Quercus lobata]